MTENDKREYNLEERTAVFAEKVIELMKELPSNAINSRMISQVVSSAGSAGANYAEASESESKKDFTHKISISKKELRETNKSWFKTKKDKSDRINK